MLRKIKNYFEAENTIRLLERMTNRELDDLGINRSEIRDTIKRKVSR
jgi:uncharacterized protein YjiS (DUF1127 family)